MDFRVPIIFMVVFMVFVVVGGKLFSDSYIRNVEWYCSYQSETSNLECKRKYFGESYEEL